MGVGERIGEAFVTIGGDNSALRRNIDDSFKLVTQSMSTLASITKSFGEGATRSFEDIAKTITGGGGFFSGLAGVLDIMGSIARESERLSVALSHSHASTKDIEKLKETLSGDFIKGTPITRSQAFSAATAAVQAGVGIGDLPKVMELGLGAMMARGIGFEDAVSKVAQSWVGNGDPLNVGLVGPRSFRESQLDREFGFRAEYGRKYALKDPLLYGGRNLAASGISAIQEGIANLGPKLFGGYSREQLDSALEAMRTKKSGVGPAAFESGIREPGRVPLHLQGINAQQVAEANAFDIGEMSPGLFGEFIKSLGEFLNEIDAIIPSMSDLASWTQSVVDAFKEMVDYIKGVASLWDSRNPEQSAGDIWDVVWYAAKVKIGQAIDLVAPVVIQILKNPFGYISPPPMPITQGSLSPPSFGSQRAFDEQGVIASSGGDEIEEAFVRAMRRSNVTPSAHRRPFLDVIA